MAFDPVSAFLRDKKDTLGVEPGYEALTAASEETGITLGMFLTPGGQEFLLMAAGVSAESCQRLLGFIGLEGVRRTGCAFLSSATATVGC
jgi:hypothetical protein